MEQQIVALLNLAEKHGILTGGTDSEGNAAYVVIDSTSIITVTIRPGGRATLIVGGEETNYDLSDEEPDEAIAFFEALSQALVEDNLDHKSAKLGKVMDEFNDMLADEDDSEEDESEDDSEEDEEDEEYDDEDSEEESDDEDSEDFADEEDEEDDSEEDEDNEELAHSDIVINKTLLPLGFKVTYQPATTDKTVNDMYVVIAADSGKHTDYTIETPDELFVAKHKGTELYSGTDAKQAATVIARAIDEALEIAADDDIPFTETELDLLIEHADAMIDDMIEKASTVEHFNEERFFRGLASVGFKRKGSAPEVFIHGGSQLFVSFKGGRAIATLIVNKGPMIKRPALIQEGDKRAALLLRRYTKMLAVYGKMNKVNVAKYINDINEAADLIENDKLDRAKAILRNVAHSNSKSATKAGGEIIELNICNVVYSIGVFYDKIDGMHRAYVIYDGRYVAHVKADYMLTVAAMIGRLSMMLKSDSTPNVVFDDNIKDTMARRLIKAAVRLGYTGQSDLEIRTATVQEVVREEAKLNEQVELAITQAQVRQAVRKLGMVVTITDGEYRVTFSKEQIPSKERREDMASYTDDPQDAIDTAKSMKEWYDKNVVNKERATEIA